MVRKICIVTGTRAEYGRLYGLMRAIKDDKSLQLQILVTGMHLSPEFGLTYRKIENDGYQIDEKVEMLVSSDTAVGITKSMGLGLIGFADSFCRLRPDIVVILGDRYEALAAAEAALVANIPIAHIHGGEVTEGAIDEAIRHSITKMSQIHFVSAPAYRKRVIQLGENPNFVFEVGAPGNDNIVNMSLLSKKELEESMNFSLGDKFFLVTYHPVTIQSSTGKNAIQELFSALDAFPNYKVIFTKANSDAGGRMINHLIDRYTEENKDRVYSIVSLGQLRFLSAMKLCAAVIGNSSSGILEAPILKIPTVNIGTRQDGRQREISIIDCAELRVEIIQAIETAVAPSFLEKVRSMSIPHTDGNVAASMKEILKAVKLEGICEKKFYDLK